VLAIDYLLSEKPRFFDLWLIRVSRCPRIRNARFWRYNSLFGLTQCQSCSAARQSPTRGVNRLLGEGEYMRGMRSA
jgi:hypothetical protein